MSLRRSFAALATAGRGEHARRTGGSGGDGPGRGRHVRPAGRGLARRAANCPQNNRPDRPARDNAHSHLLEITPIVSRAETGIRKKRHVNR